MGAAIYRPEAKGQLPGAPIDVEHYRFDIQLNDLNDVMKGEAAISLKYLQNTSSTQLDLIKQDKTGKGMLVEWIKENGKKLHFFQDGDKVTIYRAAKANQRHCYVIKYSGIPADGLVISTNIFGHRTFFGDNWPNRAHNWLPCVDLPADKASVDFYVTAPSHYQVIANGLKVSDIILPGALKLTHWKEVNSLPTKVMVIGVADFAIDHVGLVAGIPVESYVYPENKTPGFRDYAAAKAILPFYIKKIGPYAYQKLANVQSKTRFGGMENASAIFYFEKSVGSPDIEALMAHEIAHQWFGDAVTEKKWQHIWLSEGFATYMTDLYLENKYGADTLKKRLDDARRKVIAFEAKRFTPVVDTAVNDNYMQLLNANSYEKGSWILHMLRHQLGDAVFMKAISNYYKHYKGANANTDDLRREFEDASGISLKAYFKQWLYTAGHPHLKITSRYDVDRKSTVLHIEQTQERLFEFSLEIATRAKPAVHTYAIKQRITDIELPFALAQDVLTFDPGVNLLFDYQLMLN